MDDMLDDNKTAQNVAVLEERMNTIQANLTASLERFQADQARFREDIANRGTDMTATLSRLREDIANRETDTTTTLSRLREDIANRETDMTATLSKLREDIASRETRLVFYMIAIVGISFTIFGFVTA